MDPAVDHPQPGTANASYSERLRTPWWWYLAAIGVAALLAAEFFMAIPNWIAVIVLVILVVMSLLVVWRMSSGRISIVDGQLTAGERSLPLAAVEVAVGLSADQLRRLVGRHGDPSAYTFIRSWVRPGVQLVRIPRLPDGGHTEAASAGPNGNEPYWVISTRHPDKVLAALSAASVAVV